MHGTKIHLIQKFVGILGVMTSDKPSLKLLQ